MLTDSLRLKHEYEPTRLQRYGDIRQDTFYTPQEFANAYWEWCNTPSHKRDREWDFYTDIRDRVPMGTNADIRKHRNANRFH